NGFKFTNKGLALQAKAQAGTELQFTRVGIGDGSLGAQQVVNLNTLVSQKMSLPITKLKPQTGGKAVVGFSFTNQSVSAGFYFREIGLFAQDPQDGEILYCYANAGSGAEFIAAGGGAEVIEKAIDIIAIVGSASSVTATINSSLVYASQQDLTDHKTAATLDHPDGSVTTAKLAAKAVTSAKLADGAATDTVIGNRTADQTQVPSSNVGLVTQFISWFTNRLKAIMGTTNWYDTPPTTLTAANTHMSATIGIHGATSTATVNAIAQRDGAGRMKVAAPAASDDAATKGYADGLMTTHTSAIDPHPQYWSTSEIRINNGVPEFLIDGVWKPVGMGVYAISDTVQEQSATEWTISQTASSRLVYIFHPKTTGEILIEYDIRGDNNGSGSVTYFTALTPGFNAASSGANASVNYPYIDGINFSPMDSRTVLGTALAIPGGFIGITLGNRGTSQAYLTQTCRLKINSVTPIYFVVTNEAAAAAGVYNVAGVKNFKIKYDIK
ncbi:phage tail-collar fiber domain-containing protein, partial [Gorillibacterium sp. sgz5001074]|uniref:phage tail-collar fiber domain-containing protein n=1 Tax=Gorillibacterium sp. sgz5001074 TaxID=3446695 RepID=UPI003F67F3F8